MTPSGPSAAAGPVQHHEARTGEFARNHELDGVLLTLSQVLAPAAEASAQRWTAPTRPMVLIVGPPRCGSTYLLQRLAATGTFGYPSNVVARFAAAPYVGAVAHRLLFDPALDYRGEMSAELALDDQSTLGKTVGAVNVNEFWSAWRPFLPDTGADEFSPCEVDRIDGVGLQSALAGLEAGFDRPLALKAQLLSFHAELLAELFPTALLVWPRRDHDELVDSVLRARLQHGGSTETWWSLRPLGHESLADRDPRVQVSAQLRSIERALHRADGVVGDRMIQIDFDELRNRPALVDDRIRQRLGPLGVQMAAVPGFDLGRPPNSRHQNARNKPTTNGLPTTTAGDAAPLNEDHLLLYNRREFIRRNLGPGDTDMRFDHRVDDRLVGTLAGTLRAGLSGEGNPERVFHAGHSAPFSGPDFVRSSITPSQAMGLLDTAIEQLRRLGVDRFRLSLRPASYSSVEPLVLQTAFRAGFQVESSELSCAIRIGNFDSVEHYIASLKRETRRALSRTENQPWSYAEVDDWAAPYALLTRNRAAKGRDLRLPLDYLEGLRRDFPGRLRCFELRHDEVPVAAALLYRLTDSVESVQYWGDDSDLAFSPMPQLARHVVGQAIAEGLDLVDLGKSSIDGEPDEGLVQFKRSVGAVAEPILTLSRRV